MLLALTLTLALSAPPALQEPAEGQADTLQQNTELVNAYEEAFTAWKKEIRDRRRAKDDSWRELRDRHPVTDFWARFQALSEAGEGRALHWMALHVEDRFEERDQAKAEKRALFERLIAGHRGEAWLADAVAELPRQRRWLGNEGVAALLEAAAGEGAHAEVASRALFVRAGQLSGRKATPEDEKRAEELYERIHSEWPETAAGAMAEQKVFAMRHLRVGREAADFTAVDADGVTFKLSDYRGKVVLVDFWGFW